MRFEGLRVRVAWLAAAAGLAVLLILLGAGRRRGAQPAPQSSVVGAKAIGCRLTGNAQGAVTIKHVIFIQFDNVHFSRQPGYANVPSDLEQMPNLLNFIEQNGVLDSDEHTPLISHTANDILTALTGTYADQVGQPVANSYFAFRPDGSIGGSTSSFSYWTAKSADGSYNLLTAQGKNAPAPWVSFTRAGCNVGAVGIADMEAENYRTDQPALSLPLEPTGTPAQRAQTDADFLGVAVHCARGAALCATANGGLPDSLPDEPGGYSGYQALFGHKTIAPQINPVAGGGVNLDDLNGKPIQAFDPASGCAAYTGFPGFGPISAAQTLAYVADMQEHDVPVTFAYVADAHDNHACAPSGNPNPPVFGPGEAGFVARLAAYDEAFGTFFARLKQDGIDQHNTLFIFSADENDHFVGGQPANPDCDGVHTACHYAHVDGCAPVAARPCPMDNVGVFAANSAGLLAGQPAITTAADVHFDAAPAYYLPGDPAQTDSASTRPFERAVGRLRVTNPLSGQTDTLTAAMADRAAMGLLHMVTGDPARAPTFIAFDNPDYFTAGAPKCAHPPDAGAPCVAMNSALAWNHGDIQPDIVVTWLGLAGPGVRRLGVVNDVWSDHADIRPTMLALLGLRDGYVHQGRPLWEFVDASIEPASARVHADALTRLGVALKQIDAPVGPAGLAGLQIATAAMESGDGSDDTLYGSLDGVLSCITAQRDQLAGSMLRAIEDATFDGRAVDEAQAASLIRRAQELVQLAEADVAEPEGATCAGAGSP